MGIQTNAQSNFIPTDKKWSITTELEARNDQVSYNVRGFYRFGNNWNTNVGVGYSQTATSDGVRYIVGVGKSIDLSQFAFYSWLDFHWLSLYSDDVASSPPTIHLINPSLNLNVSYILQYADASLYIGPTAHFNMQVTDETFLGYHVLRYTDFFSYGVLLRVKIENGHCAFAYDISEHIGLVGVGISF